MYIFENLGSELLRSSVQTNSTESDGDGTKYKSESILSYTFTQSHLASKLKCIVKHPAYQSSQKTMISNLDVLCKFTDSDLNYLFIDTIHS